MARLPLTEAELRQRRHNVEMMAALKRSRTHCKYGHEFTPENTYIRPEGRRECRVCIEDRHVARYEAQKRWRIAAGVL
jgi:hypothetical protein